MNKYKVITITHRKANLRKLGNLILRNDLSQSPENSTYEKEKLQQLKEQFSLSELMYLSTCNRVTYFFVGADALTPDYVHGFLSFLYEQLTIDELKLISGAADVYEGKEAVRHMFHVAASLDSMVVGEREISRQIKDAYHKCKDYGLTGDNIRIALKKSIMTAKRVFTETRIAQKPVSVVSLAMTQLTHLHLPKNTRFLLIGAGQTNNLVGKFLFKHGFSNVDVFNRTLENAKLLADKFNGNAYTLDQLSSYDKPFEVIIICTGATEAIVTDKIYKTLGAKHAKPKIVVDLAVPHNVARDVVEQNNINYIDVDHLKLLSEENKAFRQKETDKAKVIIDGDLDEFEVLFKQRQIERALNKIPGKLSEIRLKAVDKVFQKEIANMDSDSRQTLERVMDYLEKKYVSIPMTVAKKELLEKDLM